MNWIKAIPQKDEMKTYLNLANYSDKSRVCLFAAAPHTGFSSPRPNAGEGLGVRGNPIVWIRTRHTALDGKLNPSRIRQPCARPLTP